MIKGFFFDLDGTLINTYKADFLAYRDAIKQVLNIDVSEADFAKTHGEEMRQKFVSLSLEVSDDDAQRVAAAKKEFYKQYLDTTVPNDELISFLANFAEHHAMVLVTNAKRDNALIVLKQHNIEQYFSHTVFGDEVSNPKPHPEAYQIALEKAGLKPEEGLAFEDAEPGIASAEAAGLAVVRIRKFSS